MNRIIIKFIDLAVNQWFEVWLLKRKEQRKLIALEMNYVRRSARVPRLQKISNPTFGSKMQAEQSIFDRT